MLKVISQKIAIVRQRWSANFGKEGIAARKTKYLKTETEN